MPAVSDLNRLGSAHGRPTRILARAVAGDHLDRAALLEPGGQAFGGALRQQVGDPPGLQIDQDGAVGVTLPAPSRRRRARGASGSRAAASRAPDAARCRRWSAWQDASAAAHRLHRRRQPPPYLERRRGAGCDEPAVPAGSAGVRQRSDAAQRVAAIEPAHWSSRRTSLPRLGRSAGWRRYQLWMARLSV